MTASSVDRSVAAALAGSAAASAAVPDADGEPASLAWRWVVGTDAICLYADEPSSPDWRATCLGAGGALHRARVALAAEGLATQVTLLPDVAERGRGGQGDQSAHLARLVTTGSVAVTPEARELYDATDPLTSMPGQAGPVARASGRRRATVRGLVAAARAEGVRLRLVTDVGDLAGLLHGPDTREAWLRAGAALSAVRLTARRRGLLTIASPTTDAASRRGRRRVGEREGWLTVGIGTPYVRLRLRPA